MVLYGNMLPIDGSTARRCTAIVTNERAIIWSESRVAHV